MLLFASIAIATPSIATTPPYLEETSRRSTAQTEWRRKYNANRSLRTPASS